MRHLVAIFGLVSLLFVLSGAVSGCDRPIAPPLVEVTELAPNELESGDRLEVHGSGFPQSRAGKVTLRGTLFRAGETPSRTFGIEADGTVVTPDRLEIVVREPLVERFCGRGDRAVHATFRGEVEVSFASSIPGGAPPLVGRLREATLDVMPASLRASIAESRAIEGGKVLAFLGITTGAATSRGLPIEQVATGSLAHREGIEVGDVVTAVDGVHALSVADVLPATSRSVELTIRHGASESAEIKTLSLVGYAGERFPADYAPALVIIGLGLAVMFVLLLPGPRSLATLEQRVASRLRKTSAKSLALALFGTGRDAVVSILLSAVLAGLALTPYVLTPEIDGVVLFVSGASMLVWSRAALERGAGRALRALVHAAFAALAMGAALALVVVHTGAIELAEIVHAQGGAPWQVNAARHPAGAILAFVYVAAIVAILRTRRPEARPPAHASLLERAGLLLAAALAVTSFLGGWQVPGAPSGTARAWVFAGAWIFLAKTWGVAAFCLAMSRIEAPAPAAELPRVVLRRLLPGLALAALVVALSRRLVPEPVVETAFGACVVALTLLFTLRVTTRIRAAAQRPEPHASPFL